MKNFMELPEKIYPVEYAGFFDFNEKGIYDTSVINRDDYENAEQIANEMARRYNEFPELQKLLSESWQMWKDLAEAGELKIGPNYWVRYAEMKLKVEALIEKK